MVSFNACEYVCTRSKARSKGVFHFLASAKGCSRPVLTTGFASLSNAEMRAARAAATVSATLNREVFFFESPEYVVMGVSRSARDFFLDANLPWMHHRPDRAQYRCRSTVGELPHNILAPFIQSEHCGASSVLIKCLCTENAPINISRVQKNHRLSNKYCMWY